MRSQETFVACIECKDPGLFNLNGQFKYQPFYALKTKKTKVKTAFLLCSPLHRGFLHILHFFFSQKLHVSAKSSVAANVALNNDVRFHSYHVISLFPCFVPCLERIGEQKNLPSCCYFFGRNLLLFNECSCCTARAKTRYLSSLRAESNKENTEEKC